MKELLENITPLLLKKKALIDETVFIEPELSPLIKKLFNYPKSQLEESSAIIIPLFKDIIAMEKSSGAFDFYQMLEKSGLSFSEELLLYAIDAEPYYNNNDDVFLRYLIVASQNTEVTVAVKAIVEKIGEGHKDQFYTVFNAMVMLRRDLEQPVCAKKISDLIVRVIESNKFYQTKRKAIAVAIAFGMKEALPAVKTLFENIKQDITKSLDVKDWEHSDYREISSKSLDLAALAQAIIFLE